MFFKTDKYIFKQLRWYPVPCLLGIHEKIVHPMFRPEAFKYKKWVYCKHCKTEWITWI